MTVIFLNVAVLRNCFRLLIIICGLCRLLAIAALYWILIPCSLVRRLLESPSCLIRSVLCP